MKDNQIELDKRKRNLTLPPSYIDSNIMINATLESDLQWQKNNPNEYIRKKDQIESSCQLLYNWNPDNLYTSRYAVAEFFVVGQTNRFGKTFEELNRILNNEILVNCTLLPARFSEAETPNEKLLADALKIKFEYESFDDILIVFKNGNISRARSGGMKHQSDNIFDYERKKLKRINYEFPFFEYMLFIEVSKLGLQKIGLKDILHLIYAQYPPVVYLVSHDKELREIITSLDFDGYYSVEGIESKELIKRHL